jgi:hypothetical protein
MLTLMVKLEELYQVVASRPEPPGTSRPRGSYVAPHE